MPAFSLALGAAIFVAFWVGGDVASGAACFAIMAALAAVFLLGGRSETLRGLAGPGRDERFAQIDLRATSFSGAVIIFVLIGAWLFEIARGGDGSPYGQLMAVGGVGYIGAVAWLRWRG